MTDSNSAQNLPVVLSDLGDRLNRATMNYQELTAKYDPVGFTSDGGAMVVTRTPKALADYPILDRTPERPSLRELGTTGQTNFGFMAREDYNPELRGLQGLRIYDRMRKSDAQVRATLRLVKTPVLAARWYVDAASPSTQDEKIAKWIDDNLNKWMTYSFNQFLTEILLMLDYGFYAFEKVFTYREGKVMWQKFAPRHPTDVTKWDFDKHGGLKGMYVSEPMHYDEIYIPVDKLAVFTFEMEAGDVEGTSVLRSAYKHWYFKDNFYKIDAIQKERHGIGIPMIVLPPNFTEEDKRLADEIGRNLRTNEKAHVVLPPLWELSFLKLEGQPVNAIESINHHDVMIARNILGQFLNSPQGTSQEEQQQLFLKATRYIADMIRDIINKYCIPQIVNWNWGEVDEYPELKVRRIGDTVDWRTISFAIRNFVGSGIIVPDDPLESWVRQELDLPKADPASERIIVAPQEEGEIPDGAPDGQPGAGTAKTGETRANGGAGDIRNFVKGGGGADVTPGAKARGPRQSDASGMRSARSPGSNGRVGRDNSGG
jgi:hypothetical protein